MKGFSLFRLMGVMALASALGLGLTACNPAAIAVPGAVAPDTPIAGPGGTVTTPATAISKIQAATVKACGFLPTANFLVRVAATFTNYDEALLYAQSIATGICAQVDPSARVNGKYVSLGRKDPGGVSLRGVPIGGRFTR